MFAAHNTVCTVPAPKAKKDAAKQNLTRSPQAVFADPARVGAEARSAAAHRVVVRVLEPVQARHVTPRTPVAALATLAFAEAAATGPGAAGCDAPLPPDVALRVFNTLRERVKSVNYTLIDVTKDGSLSLMDENNNTREDLNLPPGDEELETGLRAAFEEGKDVTVTVVSAMGKEVVMGFKYPQQKFSHQCPLCVFPV